MSAMGSAGSAGIQLIATVDPGSGERRFTGSRVPSLNRAVTRKSGCYVCSFMIRNLGGVRAFAAKWAQELQLAITAAPGSRRVLKTFEAIVRLHQFSEEHETLMDELTDSELESVLHDEIKIVIARDPEFAVAALEQRGWTLIPPESDVSGDTVTGPKTGPTSSNFSWRRADERLPAKGEQGRVDPNGSG